MAEKDAVKGKQITGAAREDLRVDLKTRYEKGASIRALAKSTGRSYGFVHRLLGEAGTTMRPHFVKTSSVRANATAASRATGLPRNTRTRS